MSTTGALSNYLETQILNHAFLGNTYSPPYPYYLALYYQGTKDGRTEPGDDDAAAEMVGGGYTRKISSLYFSTSASMSNANSITFPTATSNWFTITGWGIRDAALAGNLIYHGELETPITILAGQAFSMYGYNLSITLKSSANGGWTTNGAHQAVLWLTGWEGFSEPLNGLQVALARDVTADEFGNLVSWTELSAEGYARKVIPASSSSWAISLLNILTCKNEIAYTTSAPVDWGVISHVIFYDNNGSPGTSSIFWGKLATEVTVNAGDGFKIPAYSLSVSIN